MSDELAADILARARAREAARVQPRIDYDAANKQLAAQKAALDRAVSTGDKDTVLLACARVHEWSRPPFNGAWPDDWARWQRALDDVFPLFSAPLLEDIA